MKIELVDAYALLPHIAPTILYELLKERNELTNISHRALPDWDKHLKFFNSHPYPVWCLIKHLEITQAEPWEYLGAVYLTDRDEIGVFVFEAFRGKGIGTTAVTELIQQHPRARYLANINPRNAVSIGMFAKLGFEHIQNTYELKERRL